MPSVQSAAYQRSLVAFGAGWCAENDSCYGDISAATGAAKTVAVLGYTRSVGTYVIGH